MWIDIHTHVFPSAVAEKVCAQLTAHYGITCSGSGVIDDLLQRAQMAGLDNVVVHSAATTPEQVVPANTFALHLERMYPEVIAFGTVHPEYADWEAQLRRLKKHNIRGLKLHPEFQGFWLNDPKLHPIIEAAQQDFIFMVHIGDNVPPQQNPSCPYKLAALLDQFPKARFIAAHMGGYLHWEHSLQALAGRDVFMDTSSTLDCIDDTTLKALFAKHDRERILYGSDYPLYDPQEEMVKLQQRIPLSDTQLTGVMHNAAKLLNVG